MKVQETSWPKTTAAWRTLRSGNHAFINWVLSQSPGPCVFFDHVALDQYPTERYRREFCLNTPRGLPPDRFYNPYVEWTRLLDMDYGIVVDEAAREAGFHIYPDEVLAMIERLLAART